MMMSRRITLKSERAGVTLAMVLAASLVMFMLWSQAQDGFRSMLTMRERALLGAPGAKEPDIGSALGAVIGCLRVAPPPTSPYRCRLAVGLSTNRKPFTVDYSGAGETWSVVITPGENVADPVCPSCPTAGTGP